MAGTWIKIGTSLHNKPEVLGIAQQCGLGVDTVVGKLVRMWAWFDEMSANGHVSYGTNVWLNSYVGHDGFAEACVNVGWLVSNETGLTMPNFDRHNGESSKKRLSDAVRKQRSRASQVNSPPPVREMSANGHKKSVTREEKIREERELPPARETGPDFHSQVLNRFPRERRTSPAEAEREYFALDIDTRKRCAARVPEWCEFYERVLLEERKYTPGLHNWIFKRVFDEPRETWEHRVKTRKAGGGWSW